jgi:hypothetical protein
VEVVRTREGWRFSEDTVANVPALYHKLPGEIRLSRDRRAQFGTPRETMYTFLLAANQNNWELAARCLDLRDLSPAVRAEYGPVLAAKLKYVLDRLGRVYLPSIPNDPDGRRYVHYRGRSGGSPSLVRRPSPALPRTSPAGSSRRRRYSGSSRCLQRWPATFGSSRIHSTSRKEPRKPGRANWPLPPVIPVALRAVVLLCRLQVAAGPQERQW